MYINLHLPQFNFAYLFFLFFFLSFPLNIFVSFIVFALFPTWHFALVLFSSFYFSYLCSELVGIIFGFLCLLGQSILYFCWTVLTLLMGYMYMCILHYFNYYLPDFVTAICLGFIFGFSFLVIYFNLT